MQRPLKQGKRPRISVSLDPDLHEWIQRFNGPSDSYTVCQVLRAAMNAGITVEQAAAKSETLRDFFTWLSKKKKTKQAAELHALLTAYFER